MNNNNVNEILKLYNNFIIFVNTDKKIVELVMDSDIELKKDISYEEFSTFFQDYFELDDECNSKMLRFLTQLNIADDNIFTFEAKYTLINGEKIPMIIKGKRIDGFRSLLSFSSERKFVNKTTDELTRLSTTEALIPVIKNAILQNIPFAIMLFDIDNFSAFNEKYGNIYGDILLVETAAAIKRVVKTNGYIARESSDRFLIMLYIEDNYDYIHAACTNIRNSVMDLTNHNVKQANITATIGCATYPKDGQDFDLLYKKSFMALQRGKRKGRNCFIIYTEERCGLADTFVLPESKFDYSSNIVSNLNIVAGAYEILNRTGSKERNIRDALSLIGTYFLLDRINFFNQEPNTLTIKKIYSWHNPLIPEQKTISKPGNIELWHQIYNNLGMVKIVQVDSNKNLPIYDILKKNDISSVLAFDLVFDGIEVGQIRFEMANNNRFWSNDDVSTLNLISKIFSIYIYKDYEKEVLERNLSYDRLTGLFNYSKWLDVVYSYTYENNIQSYSIIHFSFSNFMHLNDVLGTNTTDEALKIIAKGLTELTTDEIYARPTEDRFLIFTTNTNIDVIDKKFNSLINYLNENYKYGYHFKFCAGICVSNNPDEPLLNIIDKANLARKTAIKREQKYVVFNDELFEAQKYKNELELHQNEALQNGEFKLYLQPKINTSTGKIAGAEALTRWYYKNENMVYPNTFIPLFEENGFIKELDLHVFENVCKFLKEVIDAKLKPITISVNLSMYQRNFDEYLDRINEIREKYDVPAKYLEIEITESTYVKNINNVIDLLRKLHENGYHVSMDDFGTGYSNLASLATFDFDIIKLDKNFCSDKDNLRERAILTFVVKLAKSLNIKVLCEGVETKELVDFLKEIGCTLIQGYYFDKPMPADDLKTKYLTTKTRKKTID